MKAVILAGGKGTRGKPYTDYFPKAMTPVEGRPLIARIVEYIGKFDFVGEVIIVADFRGLGGQIKNYYQNANNKTLSFVQDSQSGTGGDLLHAEASLEGESEFILWFVDNLCAIDLNAMRRYFHEKKSVACIATRAKRREETGFVMVENGVVREFKEKPMVSMPMSECLGVYMLQSEVLDRIRAKKRREVNLSYDILEQLACGGKVSAFDIGDTDWIDAESPVILERNKKTVQKITRQMEH